MKVDYSAYQNCKVNVSEGIAVVAITWSGKTSAREHHAELPRLLRDLSRDPEVNVGVLTEFDSGGRYGDIVKHVNEHPAELPGLLDEARDLLYAQIDMDKPMVAALNRNVGGSVAHTALLCDWIIAERHVLISDGHVAAGLATGDGGPLIWPLTVGFTRAKRHLLLAEPITASDAERFGLITEVVETGESGARAMDVARRMAALPQTALRYTKRGLNQILRQGALTAFDYTSALEFITMALPETGELI